MTSLELIAAPSPNFDERREALDMLVLHYTGMADGPSALARMRDPAAKVSAHYMVEEDGRIFQLVADEQRAWHAGVASWAGRSDINSRSIGIEIVNGGHDYGLPDFPDIQMDVVISLCRRIMAQFHIPQTNVVGHSDIAPERKQDPGEKFPWARLARDGVGIWPELLADCAPVSPEGVGDALMKIGYPAPQDVSEQGVRQVITAFQRRWLPAGLTGVADEVTRRRLGQIAALY